MRASFQLLAGMLALGCGDAKSRIEGAGSSFIDPMMQEWAGRYKKDKGVPVNYQSKGSGAGIKMMTGQEVDFGCSDAPLSDEQLESCRAAGGDVIHVPLCMGAIVPAYNLPGLPDLTFDGPALVAIFLGKITKWDDPALVKLNPGKKLPGTKITVAFRSDASGSSYILTDYFTQIDKAGWTPGKGTAPKFPHGTGAKGSDGVAGLIKGTEGTIGYVEMIYALKNDIPYGRVVNSKGKAVKAEMKSVTAAAATADIPDDLRYSIVNPPGEDAYPISGTVWAIAYVKQGPWGQKLKDFLWWVTHDGQALTETLHYAALPEPVVKKVEAKLGAIK
ncbi:MAG: phosphate ABC transporter substrate-binding protein PstS [Gemmataceae bacterium]